MNRTTHSLDPLIDPRTMAILGASNDVHKFGGRPIRYMLEGGYTGKIFPVNPKGGEIQGLTAYADVRDIPEPVDVAVVSLPAPFVVDAARGCVEAGVRSMAIFSSSFAEVDEQGRQWQDQLSEIARTSGMRIMGPNCMGMLNVHSRAIGTFSSAFEHGWPRPGGITVFSQSGAVGSHILVLARERGIGLRAFATTGNECDVDVADCISYGAEDPETKVIVVYMEGCKHPDRLIAALESARRHGKPVIVMKVGASDVGAIAASTHTASLAGADAVFDAIFRQYGAYRVHSLDEMMLMAGACAAGKFPAGRRLGIVTISGGVGVLSSDTAAACGLEVPALPEKAQAELKALMPFAAVRNPVDTTAQMLNDVNLLKRNMEVILDHGDCDAVMVFLTSVGFGERMMSQMRELLPAMRAAYPNRLIVLSMLAKPDDVTMLESHGYLVVEDPSRAIEAIAAMAGFGENFARPAPQAPLPPPATARPAPAASLSEVEAATLLSDAGLPVVETRLATSAAAAAAAADALGYPVVMKVVSAAIQHKSDVGGVRLNLGSAADVEAAYAAIMDSVGLKQPDAAIDGVLVAPMVGGGVETILGTYTDPVFGPVVLFGLGGVFVEVLKDVTYRVAPFGLDEAHRMIREVKGFAMLEGVRGQAPADLDALAEALVRLSVFAHDNRDTVDSIDVNPFLVLEKGAVAVDALIVPKN